MHDQVNEHFLDLVVFADCKPFDEIHHPHLSMVLQVLPDQLIEILADDESLVADAVDDAGHQHHVVLLLFAIRRVEDHLHNLLGNAEQLDAVVNQTFLEEGGELLDLVELPVGVLF